MTIRKSKEHNDIYYRNQATGRKAKITTFKKPNPEKGIMHKYYVALFEKGELQAGTGHYCSLLRHAHGDALYFVTKVEV